VSIMARAVLRSVVVVPIDFDHGEKSRCLSKAIQPGGMLVARYLP
jgi:hypothetical protein